MSIALNNGINTAFGDGRYLRLDCSNDPLTGDLSLGDNDLSCGTLYASDTGQSIFTEGLVVNEDGGNAATDDFRCETNSEANAFVVDASGDDIEINVPAVSTDPITALSFTTTEVSNPQLNLGTNELFNTDTILMRWGKDEEFYYSGLPLRMYWSNGDIGSNGVVFDDGAGNALYVYCNPVGSGTSLTGVGLLASANTWTADNVFQKASGTAGIKIATSDGNISYLRLLENLTGNDYGALIEYTGATNTISLGSLNNGAETDALTYARGSSNVTVVGNLTIGVAAAGVDYTLTFDGESDDCVITYDEDNNKLNLGDTSVYNALTSTGLATAGDFNATFNTSGYGQGVLCGVTMTSATPGGTVSGGRFSTSVTGTADNNGKAVCGGFFVGQVMLNNGATFTSMQGGYFYARTNTTNTCTATYLTSANIEAPSNNGQVGPTIVNARSASIGIPYLGTTSNYGILINADTNATDGLKHAINIGNVSGSTTQNYAIVTAAGNVRFGDKVSFTQTDNNEYIDSLADGYLDIAATTGVRLLINGTEQVNLIDGVFQPTTTNDIDLGTSSLYFKNLYIYDTYIHGDAANRIISMGRETTAATAGRTLTINAGGATSGSTNKAGGGLYLQSGISTGSGTGSVYIQTCAAGASGTSDNSPATVLTATGLCMALGGSSIVSTTYLNIASTSSTIINPISLYPTISGAQASQELNFNNIGGSFTGTTANNVKFNGITSKSYCTANSFTATKLINMTGGSFQGGFAGAMTTYTNGDTYVGIGGEFFGYLQNVVGCTYTGTTFNLISGLFKVPTQSGTLTGATINALSACFQEDVLIESDQKLIFEGTFNASTYALVKGDSYLVFNASTTDLDLYIDNTQVMNFDNDLIDAKVALKITGGIQSDGGNAGIDGSFLDADGNTITVENGLITAITPP
jgi:hypothetical protein